MCPKEILIEVLRFALVRIMAGGFPSGSGRVGNCIIGGRKNKCHDTCEKCQAVSFPWAFSGKNFGNFPSHPGGLIVYLFKCSHGSGGYAGEAMKFS